MQLFLKHIQFKTKFTLQTDTGIILFMEFIACLFHCVYSTAHVYNFHLASKRVKSWNSIVKWDLDDRTFYLVLM